MHRTVIGEETISIPIDRSSVAELEIEVFQNQENLIFVSVGHGNSLKIEVPLGNQEVHQKLTKSFIS